LEGPSVGFTGDFSLERTLELIAFEDPYFFGTNLLFSSSFLFSYFLTNSSIRPWSVILGPPLDLTILYTGILGGLGAYLGCTTTSSSPIA
jgi:hypothetical protein